MKKGIVWILLILLLAGCGRQSAPQVSELELWVTSQERGDIYEALAQRWNEENPQEAIRLSVSVYTSQSISSKFQGAGYGDSGIPDLVELDYRVFPEFVFQQTADLYPLQNLLNKHGGLVEGSNIYSKNNICFALPYHGQQLVLCYRLDLEERFPEFRHQVTSFEGLRQLGEDQGETLLWVDYLGCEVFLAMYLQTLEEDEETAYDRVLAFLREAQESGAFGMLPSGDAYSDSLLPLLAEGAVPCFVTTQAQLRSLAAQNPQIPEQYGVAGLPSFGGNRYRVTAPAVAVAVHMSGSDPVLSRKFLEYCRFSEEAKAYPEFYIGEEAAQQDLSEIYRVLGSLNRQPGKMSLTAMDLAPYLGEYSRLVLDVIPE